MFFSGCYSFTKKEVDTKIPQINKNNKIIKEDKACKIYKKNMKYASSYIFSEFENGYFKDKDMIGAKAQLFLIKNRSESVFSQNINEAETFYISQYNKAKKKNCNLKQFYLTPLKKIQNKIK